MSASEMERLKKDIEANRDFADLAAGAQPTRDGFIDFARQHGYEITPEDFGWKAISDEDFQAIRNLFASKPAQSIVSTVQYC